MTDYMIRAEGQPSPFTYIIVDREGEPSNNFPQWQATHGECMAVQDCLCSQDRHQQPWRLFISMGMQALVCRRMKSATPFRAQK